ncbi:MAG: class I SAM-dependent methyltransferase [Clostridia bacterium]|nr:class I SAM-dependent methyltransferase [Clostridia bacterium]
MEFRKIFDTIPEQFDRYRPRYCPALFTDLIAYAGIGPEKSVLELGPGTGQATEPILDTGCDYHAIELGEHLVQVMMRKYFSHPNFHIVNGDFITHDFGNRRFDLIYSAATIQWIPEEIAFAKTFDLLKPGGTLAMMLTKGDYRTPNEALFQKIQDVYSRYFHPETEYRHGSFTYTNAPEYGYVDFEKREYPGQRVFTADEYISFCGTHCDHIVIPEPDKTNLFTGLREAVWEAGNRIVFQDTYVLYLTRKPLED